MSTHPLLARLALAVAWPAMIVAVFGCEREQTKADRKVAENLSKAEAMNRAGDHALEAQIAGEANRAGDQARARATSQPAAIREALAAEARGDYLLGAGDQKRAAAAMKLIEQAAGEKASSKASQVVAIAMLAQSHYNNALILVPQIIEQEEDAKSLLQRISSAAVAISNYTVAAEAQQATNPKVAPTTQISSARPEAPQAVVEQLRSSHQQEIAELDKLIAEIKGTIDAQTKVIADLQKRLKSANTESAELRMKSEQAKEPQAGELFRKAAAAKALAAILSQDLRVAQDDLDDQTGELKLRLLAATTRRQAAENSLKSINQAMSQMTGEWSLAQQQAQTLQAESKAISDREIAPLAQKYEALLNKTAEMRAKALAEMSEAVRGFADADTRATQVCADLNTQMLELFKNPSPSKPVWEAMQKYLDPKPYKIRLARALIARANLHLGLISVLQAQQQVGEELTPIYKAASLTVPPSLGADSRPAMLDLAQKAGQDLETAPQSKNAGDSADKILAAYSPDPARPTEALDSAKVLDPGIRMDARLASVEVMWDLYRLEMAMTRVVRTPLEAQRHEKLADSYLKNARVRLRKLADSRLSPESSEFERSFPLPKFAEELDVVLEPYRRGQAPGPVVKPTTKPTTPSPAPKANVFDTIPAPRPGPNRPTPAPTPGPTSAWYKFAGPSANPNEAPGQAGIAIAPDRAGRLRFAGLTYDQSFTASILADGTLVADKEGVQGRDAAGATWISQRMDVNGRQLVVFVKK